MAPRVDRNTSSKITAALLTRADAADGKADGRIDLRDRNVRKVLRDAGFSSRDVVALDRLDNRFRSDGKLDLVAVARGPKPVMSAVVRARRRHIDKRLTRLVVGTADMRRMTGAQYRSHVTKDGGAYKPRRNFTTRRIAMLKRLRAEATDPQMKRVAGRLIALLTHLNRSTTQFAVDKKAARGQAHKALRLVASFVEEANKLGPEFKAEKKRLLQSGQNLTQLLMSFEAIAMFALSPMGQWVNSAPDTVAQYVVQTMFRHAADLRRGPEKGTNKHRHGGTIAGAIASYGGDLRIHLLWERRLNAVRKKIGTYPNRAAYEKATARAVHGAAPGMVRAAVKIARAHWHVVKSSGAIGTADKAIDAGERYAAQTKRRLDAIDVSVSSANAWKANAKAALLKGDYGDAHVAIGKANRTVARARKELARARRLLAKAERKAKAADRSLTTASKDMNIANRNTLSVEKGNYARRFRSELYQLRDHVHQLEVQIHGSRRELRALNRKLKKLRRRAGRMGKRLTTIEKGTPKPTVARDVALVKEGDKVRAKVRTHMKRSLQKIVDMPMSKATKIMRAVALGNQGWGGLKMLGVVTGSTAGAIASPIIGTAGSLIMLGELSRWKKSHRAQMKLRSSYSAGFALALTHKGTPTKAEVMKRAKGMSPHEHAAFLAGFAQAQQLSAGEKKSLRRSLAVYTAKYAGGMRNRPVTKQRVDGFDDEYGYRWAIENTFNFNQRGVSDVKEKWLR